MKNKKYSIFGAGASGLYTAWRLLNGESKHDADKANQIAKGDTIELYDWGEYDFLKKDEHQRAAGGRVCTWHYQNDKSKSYLELGGMRYSEWDGNNDAMSGGHRLVTTVIKDLDLDKYSVPFNESTNPLFYLRTKNMYLNDITSSNPAPYNVNNYGATDSPDNGFNMVEKLAVTATTGPQTRAEWCAFYQDGRITADTGDTSVFQKGDLLKNIGYWNLMFDQLGSEGYNYTADGNGYTSNVINWNSAVAFQANNEFTPGTEYKTLTKGYSSMFNALFDAIRVLAKQKSVHFEYKPNTRLHSILQTDGVIHYAIANRHDPNKKSGVATTDFAWLAMPRNAIDLVAQATRYTDNDGLDVLNHRKVQLYLESAVLQPSYKVGMFFDTPWWTVIPGAANPPSYPPQLTSYEVTTTVIKNLAARGFPKKYLAAISNDSAIVENPFTPAADFIKAVEQCIKERLTIIEEEQILAAAERNTIGPSVTDMPVRQVGILRQ